MMPCRGTVKAMRQEKGKRAILKAMQNASNSAQASDQANTNEFVITFGSLSFSYTSEQAIQLHKGTPLQQTTPQQEIPVPVPVRNRKQTGTGNMHVGKHKNTSHQVTKDTQIPPTNTQAVTSPKFIKVPQATQEWQKAERKQKTNTNRKIKCYYCHKEGHIQRYCWRKIQCFQCGRYGHKYAKCHYKYSQKSYAFKPTSKGKNTKAQTNLKIPNSKMEFIHGRPPISDTFRPPRQDLNDANDYLERVGLVVLHDDHTISANRSSSSSSNDGPSEPTIDYSSWSPRSFNLQLEHTQKWRPKAIVSATQNTRKWLPKPTTRPHKITPDIGATSVLLLLTAAPTTLTLHSVMAHNPLLSATKNPNRLHNFQCFTSISQILLSLPPPIAITPLPAPKPTARERCTLGAAHNSSLSLITPSLHATPLQPKLSLSLTLQSAFITPTQVIHRAVLYLFRGIIFHLQGPSWPKTICSPLLDPTPSQARLQLALPSPSPSPPTIYIPNFLSSPTVPASLRLNGPALLDPPQGENSSRFDYMQSPLSLNTDGMTHANPIIMTEDSATLPYHGTSATPQTSKRGERKGKSKIAPTRRSQRLQDKNRVRTSTSNIPRRSTAVRSHNKKISFDYGPPETPLNLDTTILILKATGLDITEQVEDIVKEAVRKNAAADQTLLTDHQPTTPLHDPIPPLTIPGFDLPF